MVILHFDYATQQRAYCLRKGGLGQNHLCEVHTAIRNLRQPMYKSSIQGHNPDWRCTTLQF